MYTHLLLRYGELFLKGKNRFFFEKKLLDNITFFGMTAKRIQGRMISDYFPEHQELKQVFGLVSYSPALKVEKDLTLIREKGAELVAGLKGTFKVETKRSDKNFAIKSPEMNKLVGEYIEEKSAVVFSFSEPTHILGIEINQDGTYLFLERVDCFGGVPTGVEGKVTLLLENDASVLAGLLFMKRGCDLEVIGKGDTSLLQKFSPRKIKVVDKSSGVLVTGELFENMKEHGGVVFRPLIGYLKEEVTQVLEKFNSQ